MIDLVSMLIEDEGEKFKPYVDCCGRHWKQCTCPVKGNLTIGIGRNLDGNGISMNESRYLFANDIKAAENDCLHTFPWYADLDERRQAAMLNLCFNMGIPKLLTFKKFLLAMGLGSYDEAVTHLKDSRWVKQVQPSRVDKIAALIRGSVDA